MRYSVGPGKTETVLLSAGDTHKISAYRPGSLENAIEILPENEANP